MPKPIRQDPRQHDLHDIYDRPGFKLRRAHQISQSIFMEECRAFDLTPTQYGVLFMVSQYQGLDQISLARLLGLDRSTTGMVVGALEARGLLRRSVDAGDRRKRVIRATAATARLIALLQPALRASRERLLAPFTPAERRRFLALLDKILDANNAEVRVPLLPRSPARRARAGDRNGEARAGNGRAAD